MIEDSSNNNNSSTINRVRVKGKGWDGTTPKGEGVRIEGDLEINTTTIITTMVIIIITITTGITTIMVNLDRKIIDTSYISFFSTIN